MVEETITRNPKELGERLWTLKNQGKFCDASISLNGQQIPVHANVLASFSPVFENTFEDTKISSKDITFTDVDADVMQSLIEYCYRGSLKINENNALDMLQMASILEMTSIVESCAKVVRETLNSKNCLAIFKMANFGEDEALKNYIIPFIKENIHRVCESDEFLLLDFPEVKQIFSSESKAEPENALYEALKKWINYETGRKKYLNELLDHVNLKCLSKNSLFSEANLICGSDKECPMKFLEAATLQSSDDFTNCSSSNTLIVMGGSDLNKAKKIEIYDLNLKKWVQIDYEKCTKCYYTTALIDDKIITIGGYSSKALNTVEYYDLATGQTESLPPMKYPRYETSAVSFSDNVYVLGGYSSGYLSTVEKWSPKTKTWQEVASMTVPRCGLAAAVLDYEIFVVGGHSPYLSVAEAYNPTTNTWRRCKDMLEKRTYLGLVGLNGFLYAVGGYNSSGYLKTVEKYDKSIDKWTIVQSMNIEKRGIAAGILNKRLVITGGINGSGQLASVEEYDEKNNTWTALSPLNQNRNFHFTVQVPWPLAKLALERKS